MPPMIAEARQKGLINRAADEVVHERILVRHVSQRVALVIPLEIIAELDF